MSVIDGKRRLRRGLRRAERQFEREWKFDKAEQCDELLADSDKFDRFYSKACDETRRAYGVGEIGDGELLRMIFKWLFEDGGILILLDLFFAPNPADS